MELHSLLSVAEAGEPGCYVASVDITDMEGERYVCDYMVRPGDQFGLAPLVRAAVEQWIADSNPVEPFVPPVATKADLAAYAASRRYEKEVGGIVWNSLLVHTDRDSQGKVIAERLAIEAGERNDPEGWKFADGIFRLVSNEEFISLSNAIRQHVRDCFAMEALVLAQIEAGAITTTAQIDAAFS